MRENAVDNTDDDDDDSQFRYTTKMKAQPTSGMFQSFHRSVSVNIIMWFRELK